MACQLQTGSQVCNEYRCDAAASYSPAEDRWFITMGHPGFNSPANNASGYASMGRALAESTRCNRRERKAAPFGGR